MLFAAKQLQNKNKLYLSVEQEVNAQQKQAMLDPHLPRALRES